MTILAAAAALSATAFAAPETEFSRIMKRGGDVAVSVVDAETGALLYGHRDSTPLKPASVMKVITSYAALKDLGPEYRFRTRVLASGWAAGRVERLYAAGDGDPSFNTESMWILARGVKLRGVKSVDELALDSSAFADTALRSGERAYQAAGSALSFNYNSLAFDICPSDRGQPALVTADPWEYGCRIEGRVATVAGKAVQVGVEEISAQPVCGGTAGFRVTGSIGASAACQRIYRSMPCPEEYFGKVLRENLQLLGIAVKRGPILRGAPADARELYVHESKPLSQIVEDMNHYSSNFAAEQLVAALDRTGRNGKRREVGLARLRAVVAGWGFADEEYRIVDGSGLSHENRLSARIVTRALLEALRDPQIDAEFEKSLSVAGRSGTLRRRSLVSDGPVVRAKTGTIDGVSGLAGYVRGAAGRLLAFAILQNGGGPEGLEAKWAVEKQVLQAIIGLGLAENT